MNRRGCPLEHGTRAMYRRGCRCVVCRAAAARYLAQCRAVRQAGKTPLGARVPAYRSQIAALRSTVGQQAKQIAEEPTEPTA